MVGLLAGGADLGDLEMCPPVLAAAAIGMALIGGVMSMQAANTQAKNDENRGAYMKAVADNNVASANIAARQARLEGGSDKSDITLKARQLRGQAAVSGAARGVVVSEGSEVDTQGDIALAEAHGRAVADYNTELRVIGFHQDAVNAGARGQLALLESASDAQAARSRGRTAFVSALGSAAKQGAAGFGAGGAFTT